MIPKSVLQKFLSRPLDDHRWVKSLTREELIKALADLKPPPRLYPKSRLHQLACFLLGVAMPQFGFWLDMGAGKTYLALALLKYWYDTGRLRRGLILVTSDKAYLTWQKQIERFEIDTPYVFLDGSSESKWKQLKAFGDGLVIVHYPGLVAMLTRMQQRRWEIDEDKITRFSERLDGIVADESTKLGNHRSLTAQIVTWLAEGCFARYALAGRPFGRDPALLWSQFNFLDGGETLGETLGLFRAAFFNAARNYAARGRRAKHVFDYTFNKRKMPQFTRMIQHRSITYSTEELPDLPPLGITPQVIELALPEEIEVYQNRLIEQAIEAKGNLAAMKNIFVRMRQLSSGFMAMRDDDSGDRVEIEFEHNPKLDLLLDLIDEMPEDRQAVIFYDFTYSGRLIMKRLAELKRSAIWLWSGTEKPTVELARFIEGQRRIAVVNNRVGAYSLDGLQAANYDFFYESPVSVIDRQQAERRVLRQGQERHVFQYDLVVRQTMDAKILQFHQEGKDLYATLTADPKTFFGLA